MEREVGGGIGMGNTCKPMAVSFQCMTKFTIKKKKEPVFAILLIVKGSKHQLALYKDFIIKTDKDKSLGKKQSCIENQMFSNKQKI